jgi:hypothetical protein
MKRETLFMVCDATVIDGESAGSINLVRGGDVIYISADDGETNMIIRSKKQAQAVVNAIRGISASQGWKVK